MDDDRTGDPNHTVGLDHTVVALTIISSVLVGVVLILLGGIQRLNGRIRMLNVEPNRPLVLALEQQDRHLLRPLSRNKRVGDRLVGMEKAITP